MFGCRQQDAPRSIRRNSRRVATGDQIKMVELKMSQGAKPRTWRRDSGRQRCLWRFPRSGASRGRGLLRRRTHRDVEAAGNDGFHRRDAACCPAAKPAEIQAVSVRLGIPGDLQADVQTGIDPDFIVVDGTQAHGAGLWN